MEEKKLSELADEKLDTVSGGSKSNQKGKIDLNRLPSGPTKYCRHCQHYVISKVTPVGDKAYCPECEKEI